MPEAKKRRSYSLDSFFFFYFVGYKIGKSLSPFVFLNIA
jgi:hypothetical protein